MRKLLFVMLFPCICFADDVILGDSHVGGIKQAVAKKGYRFFFKNGSTAKYWTRQKPVMKADNLFVMTGTNDYRNGYTPSQWYSNAETICHIWKPSHCYIVAPPYNVDGRYRSYQDYAQKHGAVVLGAGIRPIDGTHYPIRQYKGFFYQLQRAIK